MQPVAGACPFRLFQCSLNSSVTPSLYALSRADSDSDSWSLPSPGQVHTTQVTTSSISGTVPIFLPSTGWIHRHPTPALPWPRESRASDSGSRDSSPESMVVDAPAALQDSESQPANEASSLLCQCFTLQISLNMRTLPVSSHHDAMCRCHGDPVSRFSFGLGCVCGLQISGSSPWAWHNPPKLYVSLAGACGFKL